MSFVGAGKQEADGERRATIPTLVGNVWREVFSDHATVVAAGLAYYAIFGLMPAIAAAAAMWRQFGDVGALTQTLSHSQDMLPAATIAMLDQFVTRVPEGFGGGTTLLLALALVVWTAFRAAGGLLTALNIVYDVEETRSRPRRALIALGTGIGGILLLFIAVGLLALAPLAARAIRGGTTLQLLWLRWPALLALFASGIALLFRFAPNRERTGLGPLAWGTLSATLLCLLASGGISVYVAHLANFGRLYGSLGSIAVILLWLYANALALLVGAEIDATLGERRAQEGRSGSDAPHPGDTGVRRSPTDSRPAGRE